VVDEEKGTVIDMALSLIDQQVVIVDVRDELGYVYPVVNVAECKSTSSYRMYVRILVRQHEPNIQWVW